MSDSKARQGNLGQDSAVHETGHMLGLDHPGKPLATDEYTKDKNSLMGLGMILGLPDFQKAFCDNVTIDKPGCKPWKGA